MLHIETWLDNPILRKVSEEIKLSEIKKYVKLGKEMKRYIKDPDNGGVWLAAPQIWTNKRLIVVSLFKNRDDKDAKTIMMINPKILEHSNEIKLDEEGCLSVPWKKWKVIRFTQIKLNFLDHKWLSKTLILDNLSARIVQHEIDHLNGILFVDKISIF